VNPPDAQSTPLTHGDMLTAISDGMVALLKEFYGRGPTRAKSYYEDDLVVCLPSASTMPTLPSTSPAPFFIESIIFTGPRPAAPGLADLDHEIDRARRTTDLLAVAYVDIVGLKLENDNNGHAAGDALLQRAVRAIRANLRSYGMIVRIGGDEFLCVMSGATIEDARQRFGAVHLALAADPDPCEIKVGFAALTPQDSAAELIERADSDLPNRRAE
jgi:diguanylate cyclase (GGDEF)-like protein